MRLRAHVDVTAFLAAAGDLLSRDEPRHNLIFGICGTLRVAPDAYREAYFWTVESDETLAALLMTPPFNIVVARPQHDAALVFAARELRATRGDVPGVVGALPEVDLFARAWTDAPRLRMAHGVYAARHVRAPADVEGSMRLASLGDLDQIVEWLRAFAAEALPDDAPHLDAREAARRRLQSDVGGTALWELDGEAVSMCGFGGPTPRGIRIGPVYTPPELRGRGYGSAVTAAASQSQLDAGREYCFLFTDLANATSNKIYVDIGYELVCEAADYAFENRGAGV